MKPIYALATISGLFFLVLTTLIVVETIQNRELRQMNRELTERFYQSQEKQEKLMETLQAAQTALMTNQREFAAHQEARSLMANEAEADRASAGLNGNESGDAAPVEPTQLTRPLQVRAYMGTRFVGNGWMIPSNLRTNEQTGAVQFEPIIQLDPRSRNAFTRVETEVVERDVVQSTTYNDNRGVYPAPYYLIANPRRGGKRGHGDKPTPGTGNGPAGTEKNPFPKFVPTQPAPGSGPWASPFAPVLPSGSGGGSPPAAGPPMPPTGQGTGGAKAISSPFSPPPAPVTLSNPAPKPVPVYREGRKTSPGTTTRQPSKSPATSR